MMAQKPGPILLTTAFQPASVWMRLPGPFTGTVMSLPRRRTAQDARLTLRARFDAPLTVAVEQRRVARWQRTFVHTGQDFSALVKVPQAADVRLVVAGAGEGVVELVA